MQDYRTIPPLADMPPDYLERGHFWIQEYVLGTVIGFEMDESGLLTFGTAGERFDADSAPLHLRRGVATVRDGLDRDRLRAGTTDPHSYTFFGVVPLGPTIEYDWDSIPAFMGVDIWNGGKGDYVPEDVVERVFDAVGLETVPILEKEVPARSFDPRTYETPQSRWADGPAAGIVLRKKHGEPARVVTDAVQTADTADVAMDGREAQLQDWIDGRFDRQSVRGLLGDDVGLEDLDMEAAATAIASEVARREYGMLTTVVGEHPDRLVTAIRRRVRTFLTDAES